MKKLLSIFILSFLFSESAFGGTCKTPINAKENFVFAPEPVPYTRKNPTNRIEEVLYNRKTINVFRAWNNNSSKKYGLKWAGNPQPGTRNTFSLAEVYWNYAYPNKWWYNTRYPDIEKFLTKKKWGHDKEYGTTVRVNIKDPEYLSYLQNLIKIRTNYIDGVLLDWWHDRHKHVGGYSKNTVKEFRINLSKQLRNNYGNDFLIIGNVNWDKDSSTHQYINGVFMELYKKPYKNTNGYSCNEIKRMDKLLKYHDQNLQEPRLIAFEPWRISKIPPNDLIKKLELDKYGKINDDKYYKKIGFKNKKNYWKAYYRSSPENIKFAKLFTAMAMVIPENGYILYSDNNPDNHRGDHYHDFYDFYNTDLGKETSIGMEIKEGLGFKMYERGVIVYNYTKNKYIIKFSNQKEVTVNPIEGIFVNF